LIEPATAARRYRDVHSSQYLKETALMVNRLLITAGAVAAAAGVIFALQGFGVLGGSVMSGSSLWAALGPLIAVAGLVAVAAGLRRLRSSSSGTRS
jgi:hypothetical protein